MIGSRDSEKQRTLSYLLGFSKGKHSLTDIQTDGRVPGGALYGGDIFYPDTEKYAEDMYGRRWEEFQAEGPACAKTTKEGLS